MVNLIGEATPNIKVITADVEIIRESYGKDRIFLQSDLGNARVFVIECNKTTVLY